MNVLNRTIRLAKNPVVFVVGIMWFALVFGLVGTTFASTVELTDWTPVTGQWEVHIVNTDESSANTNAYVEVVQDGTTMTYEWTVQFESTTFSLGPAAGVHIMADSATDAVRGNSYLVFQDADYIRLYKASFGSLSKVSEFPVQVSLGEKHAYSVEFNSDTGVMKIQRNGDLIGEWTDSSPLTNGKYISLRTNGTNAVFSGVKVTTGD